MTTKRWDVVRFSFWQVNRYTNFWSDPLPLPPHQGQYLSPIGSRAVLKTRSNTVTKDELFALEDSLPQASFSALLNNRYVSVKQGKFSCSSHRLHEDNTICEDFKFYWQDFSPLQMVIILCKIQSRLKVSSPLLPITHCCFYYIFERRDNSVPL